MRSSAVQWGQSIVLSRLVGTRCNRRRWPPGRRNTVTPSCSWWLRTYLSPAIELPPDSVKSERPFTVVLAEDIGFFDDGPEQITASWGPRLAAELPREYGIPFRTWRPSRSSSSSSGAATAVTSSPTTTATTTTNSPPSPLTLREAQLELEDDLCSIPRLVLVARGPILSWLASFYLESCPAAGVILVDPLSYTDEEFTESAFTRERYMDQYLQYQNVMYPLQQRHQRLLHLLRTPQGWDDVLLLEPGAVPMAVFTTMYIRNTWKFHAHLMAARHATLTYEVEDDEDPEIPVIGLQGPNDPELVEAVANFCIHRARW